MLFELLIILALILLNGVFSGAELAILSVRKTRLAELVDEGSRAAATVLRLREQPETFLATVQIGITVVGATAAAFGGSSIAVRLAPIFSAIPGIGKAADQLALGVVVVCVSFLSLVLGELVPKSLALRAGEPYALFIARPLSGLARVARPLVRLLTLASNTILRLFGDRTSFTESRLSREEVQQVVEEATSAGSVNAEAGEIASRALDFGTLSAVSVMVPQRDVLMLAKDTPVLEIARLARKRGHGRAPVYDGAKDNIIGFVNLRDVLAEALLGPTLTLESLLHPVLFVPETMPATAVLRQLQADRTPLALVTDELGSLVGLITVEDLVEELVGEILSEHDKPAGKLQRDPAGGWLIDAGLALHEVNRDTGLDLPEGGFSTLAGLCLSMSGSMPAVGTVLTTEDGIALEIVDATPRRVRRVRVRRIGRGEDVESTR